MELRCGSLIHAFKAFSARREVEVAGLLFGEKRGSIYECAGLWLTRNIAVEKRSRYTMEPWAIVVAHEAAMKYGWDLVGVFHTHPNCDPIPSSIDKRFMRSWRVPWIIASPDSVRAWILDEKDLVVEVRIDSDL